MEQVKRFLFSDELTGLYKAENQYTFDNPADVQCGEIYACYDALVEKYPHYVSKRCLGEASFGMPVYEYTFRPEKHISDFEIYTPKIFMTTAVHGNERGPVFSAYNMLRRMCEDWKSSAILEFFRFNLEFVYIPIVNPSGFDRHTRNTAGGVNLNRNFPNGWNAGEENGTGPASEPETRIVVDAMREHGDAVLCMDYHNMHFRDGFVGYTWTADQTVGTLNTRMIHTLSRQWQQKYAFFPQEEAHRFGYSTGKIDGSLGYHARMFGMKDCVLEMVRQIEWQPGWCEYDELTLSCGTELLVNVLKCLVINL